MATVVPTCSITKKKRTSASGRSRPLARAKSFCVTLRWPSLETGRNSVTPCTRPRTIDSSQSIRSSVGGSRGRDGPIAPQFRPGEEDVADAAVDRQDDRPPRQRVAADPGRRRHRCPPEAEQDGG